jgi:hypothetical protein
MAYGKIVYALSNRLQSARLPDALYRILQLYAIFRAKPGPSRAASRRCAVSHDRLRRISARQQRAPDSRLGASGLRFLTTVRAGRQGLARRQLGCLVVQPYQHRHAHSTTPKPAAARPLRSPSGSTLNLLLPTASPRRSRRRRRRHGHGRAAARCLTLLRSPLPAPCSRLPGCCAFLLSACPGPDGRGQTDTL